MNEDPGGDLDGRREQGHELRVSPPPALAGWLRDEIGEWSEACLKSPPDAGILLWRLERHRRGPVWVKRHRSLRKYRQERDAFRRIGPRMTAQIPRLLASDDALRTLVLSELPGRPDPQRWVRGEHLVRCHRAAGAWLRRLHTVGIAAGAEDELPLPEALARRLEGWRQQAAPLGLGRLLEWGRGMCGDFSVFAGEPRVLCHRDFRTPNWMWDPAGAFGALDFEHSRADHWLTDLVRLRATCWRGRPDLEAAFLAGYCRLPGTEDGERLFALLLLHAFGSLVWGRRHGQPDREAEGWAALQEALVLARERLCRNAWHGDGFRL